MSMVDRMDQYLRGEMSPQEKADFERLLSEDTALAEELNSRKSLMKALQIEELRGVKQLLEQEEETNNTKTIKWPSWYSIAASLAAVGFFIYLLLPQTEPITDQELFDQFYQAYPNYAYPIIRDQIPLDSLKLPFYHYELGAYGKALDIFSTSSESMDTETQFYRAQCHLGISEYKEATDLLILVADSDSNYKWQSYWYLGLTNLMLGEKSEAIEWLEELVKSEGYQPEKAKELLNKITP